MSKSVLFVFFLACAFLVNAPHAYSENAITGSGCSISNVGYLKDLAKEYEKQTGIKMLIRGGGSALGLDDLIHGRVDFAASCKGKTADTPQDFKFIQVAWDALVFIVHKSNPVNDISLDNIKAIYRGKITNWGQLRGNAVPIKVLVSKSKKGLGGVEIALTEMILNGEDPGDTQNTAFFASTGIIEQMVEKTPEGFATSGFSSARRRAVKMLKVNGAYPDRENIAGGKYPFKRPLYLVVSNNPKPEVKRFIDFVLSKQGQRLVSSFGVVSLLDVHPAKKGGASSVK